MFRRRPKTSATLPRPEWHTPEHGLMSTRPTLSWQPVSGASGYWLALHHEESGTPSFYHVKAPPFTVPSTLEPGAYRCHLFTESNGCRSLPSTITLEAAEDIEAAMEAAAAGRAASGCYHQAFIAAAPPDREANTARRAQEIREAATHLTSYPSVILLNIGHLCNIDCIMCPSGRRPDPGRLPQWISSELYAYLPLAKWLLLSGGEPLVYKHEVLAAVSAAKLAGTRIGVHTNGQLLTPENAADFDSISISVDAATRETYEKIRRHADWDITVNAMLAAGARHLTLNYTIMKHNLYEIRPFMRLAHGVEAAEVTFNVMRHMADKSLASQSILFDRVDCERALEFMREAAAAADIFGMRLVDKVTPLINQVYPDLYSHRIEEVLLQKRSRSPTHIPLWCEVPFAHLTLDTRGSYVCCNAIRDLYYIPYRRESHIHDIWNGFALQKARRIIHSGTASTGLCHPSCAFYARGGYRRERDGYLWA